MGSLEEKCFFVGPDNNSKTSEKWQGAPKVKKVGKPGLFWFKIQQCVYNPGGWFLLIVTKAVR